MNTSNISIIMPVYNGERFLREAIKSILSQTYEDFEFIIINDGSTDKTLEIIDEYKDKDGRIIVISRENRGLVASLNEGIALARGEYIARMDADDICSADRLNEQIAFFEAHPECVLVGSWAETIDENGNVIGSLTYPPLKTTDIREYALIHNPFIHPSVMFRKDCVLVIGNYHASFKHNEDYELWTRIVYKYPCMNIPKKLIQYRLHSKQITKKNNPEMRIQGLKVRVLSCMRFLSNLIK